MATAKKTPKNPKDDEATKALERVRTGLAEGKITSLAGIAAAIAPVETTRVPVDFEPGLPPQISKGEREALVKLPEVFGKVVLDVRRKLTDEEVDQLLDEREVLTTIATMAENRRGSIKDTVYIGMDAAVAEKLAKEKGVVPPLQDEEGHYLTAERLGGERDDEFSRELRGGTPSLTSSDLKTLVDDEDVQFTHEDWLACTVPGGRVFDENKAMVLLRKRPELVHALAKVAKPGKTTTALFVRKAKGGRKK